MGFSFYSNSDIKRCIRERGDREETNKEVGGEVYLKCKKCEGTGLKFYKWGENLENTSWNGEFCEVCSGTGYVDWLEAIMKGTGVVY